MGGLYQDVEKGRKAPTGLGVKISGCVTLKKKTHTTFFLVGLRENS